MRFYNIFDFFFYLIIYIILIILIIICIDLIITRESIVNTSREMTFKFYYLIILSALL